MTLTRFLLSLLFLASLLTSAQEEKTGHSTPRGKVWIFVAVDCPIANGYAPELNRLQQDFESRGIDFTLVYPEPSLHESSIISHLKEYSLDFDYHHDRTHRLVTKSGVIVTPEAAVFDSNDQLIYRGKIDDRYSEFGDRRSIATKTYLRDVLEQLLAGEEIGFHETESIGCYIEALAEN